MIGSLKRSCCNLQSIKYSSGPVHCTFQAYVEYPDIPLNINNLFFLKNALPIPQKLRPCSLVAFGTIPMEFHIDKPNIGHGKLRWMVVIVRHVWLAQWGNRVSICSSCEDRCVSQPVIALAWSHNGQGLCIINEERFLDVLPSAATPLLYQTQAT